MTKPHYRVVQQILSWQVYDNWKGKTVANYPTRAEARRRVNELNGGNRYRDVTIELIRHDGVWSVAFDGNLNTIYGSYRTTERAIKAAKRLIDEQRQA